MSELFDIFDEALNHICVKPRAAVHRDGDWHQVFHCWVVGREATGVPFVLLQKRGPAQDSFPNFVDISAAGHLAAGETVRDGVRELEEELGLPVKFEALVPLGRRLGIAKSGALVDCQICHVFLYECDLPLAAYRYQEEEISGLLKLRLADGLRLFAEEVDCVKAEAIGLGGSEIALSRADFIPSLDNYTFKFLLLARRYFAGEKHLWI